MPSFPCVHHIEMGVTDGPAVVSILRDNFTFDLVATRISKLSRQWLLTKADTRYLVTCLDSTNKQLIKDDDYVIDWMDVPSHFRRQGTDSSKRKDSAFNICLQVDDLDKTIASLRQCGVHPFRGVKTMKDSFGSVRTCTIKSCVGDIYHTLVEKSDEKYKGIFLPGFTPYNENDGALLNSNSINVHNNLSRTNIPNHVEDKQSLCNENNVCDNSNFDRGSNNRSTNSFGENGSHLNGDTAISERQPHVNNTMEVSDKTKSTNSTAVWSIFDHVALAVEMGKSEEVISWYEKCFGMRRFLINSEEDPAEGLVLSTDNVSLRLRAMEYWKCVETGLVNGKCKDDDSPRHKLSMVVAEGLPPRPDVKEVDQIESWLRQHGGPGIQHIALNTSDIKTTVANLTDLGVLFAKAPPPAYYGEMGRLSDIVKAGEDADKLKQYGILIDIDADREENDEEQNETQQDRYLLQIFTKPFLPNDPCFMEIIQREGAMGFGSGNVAALYRSLQADILQRAKDVAS